MGKFWRTGEVIVGTGLVIGLVMQYQAKRKQQEAVAELRRQAEELAASPQPVATQPVKLPAAPARVEAAKAERQAELERLRAEAEALKRQRADIAGQRAAELARSQALAAEQAAAGDSFTREWEEKAQHFQHWMQVFLLYSEEVKGRAPADFQQLRELLPAEARAETDLMARNFEFVYRGALADLPNPHQYMVLRLTAPVQTPGKGTWLKLYFMGDGEAHAESSPDGNFTVWERQHQPPPAR